MDVDINVHEKDNTKTAKDLGLVVFECRGCLFRLGLDKDYLKDNGVEMKCPACDKILIFSKRDGSGFCGSDIAFS